MDNQKLIDLIKESARLERNAGKLYQLLSKLFLAHKEFWLQLSQEEKIHEEIFIHFLIGDLPLTLFPMEIVDVNLARLRECNEMIEKELQGFLQKYRKRINAYEFALKVETCVGEIIYQQAMEMDSSAEALYLVQRINGDCVDHKKRIEKIIEDTKRDIAHRKRQERGAV